MIKKETLKKASIIYALIIGAFLVLSLISLFFNEGILIAIFLVTGIFGYGSLLFYMAQQNTSDSKKYLIYTFARYAIMTVGLVISCLLIKGTMKEVVDTQRYFLVCIGAFPYICPLFSLLIVKE